MAKNNGAYTYRCGKKIKLTKQPNQFVIRRLPDELSRTKMAHAEQMSSGSSRVLCDSKDLEGLMEESRKLAPTHHAYEETENENEFLITDRVIVNFKKLQSPEEVGAFAGEYALEILQKYSDTEYLFRLTDDTGKNPVKLVVQLTEEDDRVEQVEHDLNMRMSRYFELPRDPAYFRQWHLQTHFQHPEFDTRASSRCEQAWQFLNNFGGDEVVVGVTDDGCQLDHPDFDSQNKFAGWGYFQNERLITKGEPGANPNLMHEAGSNHGTACAGVIGAEVDAQMTVGAAPGCRLLPIKWESDGRSLYISDSKMLTALNYIGDKVDVLSNSWGMSPESNWSQNVLEKIARLASSGGKRGKGIVFLWAAGNENCPIDLFAGQDVPYTRGWSKGGWVGVRTSRRFVHNLVGTPGVMQVAALASTAQRSHYSNYGPGIDICAPTSNSHTYRRMPVKGLGITTTTGSSTRVIDDFGGTSSATPLVAGIVALVISANPELTALEVISILKKTASKDLDLTGYPKTLPASNDPNPNWDVSPIAPFDKGDFVDKNLSEGTWSPWFGHGRVDAALAVEEARRLISESAKVRVEQVVRLDIPDADPAGVISRMFISDRGKISNLKIQVDIEHTYIGDLIVNLVGPEGRRVPLHQREGGSTNNLFKVFSEATTPALADFKGQKIHGPWTLEVSDHAPVDRGRLNRWSLEAEILIDSAIFAESTPGIKIPDHDPEGVKDVISIPDTRPVKEISVEVDITHTWIGDLNIELVHSNGDTRGVVLHSREGRDADDIQHTYRLADEPELSKFLGQPANGDWILKVTDNAGQDVGKLNRWALHIH